MTTSLRVRPLADRDLPTVREWMRDADGAPRWSDAEIAAFVNQGGADTARIRRAWAAVEPLQTGDADRVCGFAAATALCVPDSDTACELEFLFIAPASRRRGIARLLLEAVIDWCEQLRATELLLEVRRSNEAAQQLYLAAGFEHAGLRRAYYQSPVEDAVLMCRAITGPRGTAPYNAR